MKIIGLTGSIGMGKSTAATMLRQMHVPVHCADEAVHRLLAPRGAAVESVAAFFPAARRHDAEGRPFIDRATLGREAFHSPALMRELESVLHPLVRAAEKQFLARARHARARCVVLDIPLLFETGRARTMDAVWVVSAPAFLQRARVLARAGMNEEKFHAILTMQMPDHEKRKRADALIPTGLGRAFTFAALRHALLRIR